MALPALALVLGYRCQQVSIVNYLFWLVFVNFTPMQRDFDGGFGYRQVTMTLVQMWVILCPVGEKRGLV